MIVNFYTKCCNNTNDPSNWVTDGKFLYIGMFVNINLLLCLPSLHLIITNYPAKCEKEFNKIYVIYL